ncbi:hypothetical protein DAEQUDRAFT_730296 [Daedalea quercina L-15889]|uniref:Uncharacterized protein n=1 Tax=Daedalea quercina L-15889 TaxID=1314783 RepID=A0A165N364_9APHY|nr:hypothetical protein DAEQUDRAFT_730296 [Daedalea quercina L-15889]
MLAVDPCLNLLLNCYQFSSVELQLYRVLHDRIGLILTCYGLVFYIATYYIHSLQT